jgi:arylsulfatase A-like enzyme
MPESVSRLSRRGFLGAAAATVAAGPLRRRPNVLLILSDDHSVPHAGCYGNPDIRTPNLDRLAARGTRFDRAYVASPQCAPSRAAIMTGRSAVATGVTRFASPLPAEVRTFPELLRTAGYYTGLAGRNHHLDGPPPEKDTTLDRLGLRTIEQRVDYVKVAGSDGGSVAQFREFLDAVPEGSPFFLQLCFSDPHRPYDRRSPARHDPKTLRLPAHFPDTQLIREDFARYYNEISRMDGYVGEMLSTLEQRGLAGDTIVAFLGDNGAALLRGKGTLYEFGIRVPLIVAWPGVGKPGSATAELISGEDLAPTFLEAAGCSVPRDMTGRSFANLLRGERFQGRRYVFSERGAHGRELPTNTAHFDLSRCIVSRTHKLVYNALWQLPYHPVDFEGDSFWKEMQAMHRNGKLPEGLSRIYFSQPREMFELYDLEKDPSEFHNLAGKPEHARLESELKQALHDWMAQERDYLPLPMGA